MKKNIIYKGFIALLVLLMVSCTKENDCLQPDEQPDDGSLSLNLRYTVDAAGDNNLFSSEVETVSVFIFDSEGIYITTKTETVADLEADNYMMTFPIEENGTYKIIVLGDTSSEHYIVGAEPSSKATKTLAPGTSHISDFRVSVIHDNNVVQRELGDMFISKTSDVLVDGLGDKVVPVELIKNTKTIRVTVVGLEPTVLFTPIIRSTNGVCNAENTSPDNATEITYIPHIAVPITPSTLPTKSFQTSTLRIIESHSIPLTLEDENGDTIIEQTNSYDIVSIIKLNPKYQTQQDLDNEDEFNIFLNFKLEVLISITINNWIHVIVKPEA